VDSLRCGLREAAPGNRLIRHCIPLCRWFAHSEHPAGIGSSATLVPLCAVWEGARWRGFELAGVLPALSGCRPGALISCFWLALTGAGWWLPWA